MEQKQNPESPGHSDTAFPFTPVRLRYRDGWTPDRQRRYVAMLAATGHAGKAARLRARHPERAPPLGDGAARRVEPEICRKVRLF